MSSETPRTRILIVDDNDRVRDGMAMRIRISSESYEVEGVRTADEAFQELNEKSYDVVLCDLVLPGELDGAAITREIVEKHPGVRVVVFSGYESGERKVQVLKAGAFSYLAKPINYEELLHAIQTINSIRRTERFERSFRTLAKISHQLQTSLDFDLLAERVVHGATALGFVRARLYIYESEHKSLVGKVALGAREGFNFTGYEVPFRLNDPVIDAIFQADRPMVWNRDKILETFGIDDTEPWMTDLALHDTTWIDLPLIAGKSRVGTLAVDHGAGSRPHYDREDLEILDVFAGMAAKALKNSQTYQKEALVNASLGSILRDAPDAVITTNLQGIVTFVSPSGHRVTGHRPEKMLGQPAAKFYTDENGEKDAGIRFANQLMQDLRDGEGTISNRRALLTSPTGGPPRLVSISASLLRNDDGEAIGTMGILKELGALEAQSEQYRDVLEGFGYGTLLLGKNGNIRFINRKAARLIQMSREEADGRAFFDLVLPNQQQTLRLSFDEVIAVGDEKRVDISVVRQDGSRMAVNAKLTPIKSPTGVGGVAVAFSDKSELMALIQSGRLMALGQMVAGVAHEVNNPLNNMLVSVRELAARFERVESSQLKDDTEVFDKLKKKAGQYLEMAERNGLRIQGIVEQLRDFAKPSTFALVASPINRVVEDALGFFRTRFHNHNIVLVTELAEDLPQVSVDTNRLQQVFVNLIVNAEEAMETQPEKVLTVSTRAADGGDVEVLVTDNGSGIPEEIIDVIFDPFFTTKSPTKGTGLGLSISKSIMDMHEGTIRASRGPGGRGTTFTLRFKAAA